MKKNDKREIEYLWITQMQQDGNETEVITFQCLSGTFRKTLLRIFPDALKYDPKPGDVQIKLMLEPGTLADDDPLLLTGKNALWLLKDFFRQPEDVWKNLIVDLN